MYATDGITIYLSSWGVYILFINRLDVYIPERERERERENETYISLQKKNIYIYIYN